jgi:hypothetical protein
MPFNITSTGGSGDGAPGPRGLQGLPGVDALWNYTGEYSGGASYAVGDVATYDGQLWYRVGANGGNVGDTPSPGFWNLLAAKGTDGTNGLDGAGFNPQPLVKSNLDPNVGASMTLVGPDNPFTGAWSVGSYVRVINSVNTEEFFEGTITDFTSGGLTVTILISYVTETWTREGNSDVWTMILAGERGSGSTADTGQITFDGVQIIGAGTASGDGYGLGTIELVPDGNITSDQYLIIDPTAPNHIHIRAGGIQDESNADIFLGAEYTNVQVSDGYKSVYIRSKQQGQSMSHLNINPTQNGYLVTNDVVTATSGWTVDVNGTSYYITAVLYDNPAQGNTTIIAPGAPFVFEGVYNVFSPVNVNQWTFAPDGTFQGPAMGGVKVLGLLNSGDNDLGLYANDANIILQTADGKVDIIAPEVNIVSNAVPSSFNINTYLGATINSNRTSTYSAEEKVVATLGDFGYLNISSETDPLEGKYTTLQAPENLVIQTYGPNFGEITIQSNMGVKFNTSPTGGVYLNGDANSPETHVATIGDLPTGATGTFVSQDNKTITVTNGIITSIV